MFDRKLLNVVNIDDQFIISLSSFPKKQQQKTSEIKKVYCNTLLINANTSPHNEYILNNKYFHLYNCYIFQDYVILNCI